ncbi:mitochondrial assembly of ribosomal large subunit 1 [Cyanidiococcus yangmingshanensis]|uniref:Mitochondrial assembly of ribosomal large subunit 1 n=1 Tax=Cyanidiococcus yangmingshanensis TaxID=2690220 RepID=A0A7J7IGF1_9RHOD|nr:mitochondrial assembly of ribosomal large subunit 1 [Cyanidiococcus yangmingshanensis]
MSLKFCKSVVASFSSVAVSLKQVPVPSARLSERFQILSEGCCRDLRPFFYGRVAEGWVNKRLLVGMAKSRTSIHQGVLSSVSKGSVVLRLRPQRSHWTAHAAFSSAARKFEDLSVDSGELQLVGPEKVPLPEVRGDLPSVPEVAHWLEEEQALNVVVLDVSEKASFTDTFIIATGFTTNHIIHMADSIQRRLVERNVTVEGEDPFIEGRESDDWMLIDLGSYIVHIMTPAARERYDLEGLWQGVDDNDEGSR